MFVGVMPEMALFHCDISAPTTFTVEYHTPSPPVAPPTPSQQTTLEIPFEPETVELQQVHLKIHTVQSYPAYRMPDNINKWFSECFGYEVILAYMGDALGIKKHDEKEQGWVSAIKSILPVPAEDINFSDGAALLVTSEASLTDLHPRLGGEKAVLEKFRPNIVVDGTTERDEDFWGELTLPRLGTRIILTANCSRCTSINVDLDKGRMGEGESGKLLKKMMRDRRVDVGNKWSPIFGRYGFPTQAGEVRVGDEVTISKRNGAHTVWSELFWQTFGVVLLLILRRRRDAAPGQILGNSSIKHPESYSFDAGCLLPGQPPGVCSRVFKECGISLRKVSTFQAQGCASSRGYRICQLSRYTTGPKKGRCNVESRVLGMTLFRDLLVAQGQPYERVLAVGWVMSWRFGTQLLLHSSCIKVCHNVVALLLLLCCSRLPNKSQFRYLPIYLTRLQIFSR